MAIHPDGTTEWVPNTYEGIKHGLAGATLDFMRLNEHVGYYVDDEGLYDGAALNVSASWFAGQPIYGHVVVAHADPDSEGNTVPAPDQANKSMARFAEVWHMVWVNAQAQGQDLTVKANPDTVPEPQVITWADFHTVQDVIDVWDQEEDK